MGLALNSEFTNSNTRALSMPFQGAQKPLEEIAETPEQRTSLIADIFQYSKAMRAWEGCLRIELGAIFLPLSPWD
jgi:hypothetical protein